MNNKLLTQSGKIKLETELENLKSKRVDISQKIKDAKELGDLSENAEYHSAKEEQGLVESRILEIESLLKSATMVKPTSSRSKISVGSKVEIKSGNQQFNYEIVGMNEADPVNGKISAESPIGSALFGAKLGDEIEVKTPAGAVKLKVVKIR